MWQKPCDIRRMTVLQTFNNVIWQLKTKRREVFEVGDLRADTLSRVVLAHFKKVLKLWCLWHCMVLSHSLNELYVYVTQLSYAISFTFPGRPVAPCHLYLKLINVMVYMALGTCRIMTPYIFRRLLLMILCMYTYFVLTTSKKVSLNTGFFRDLHN